MGDHDYATIDILPSPAEYARVPYGATCAANWLTNYNIRAFKIGLFAGPIIQLFRGIREGIPAGGAERSGLCLEMRALLCRAL